MTSLEIVTKRPKIFVDDCNENTAKSKTTRAQVVAPVNLRLANAANEIRRLEQSAILPKKREVFHEVLDLIQSSVSANGYSLTPDKENIFNNQTLP